MANIIIIGNSSAGISAAESIRKADKASKLTIISDEECLAYLRYKLLDFLSGQIKEAELIYRQKEFYSENNIELFLGRKVARVEPKKSRIILEDNQKLEYGLLLIATGACVKFPDVKGLRKRGVFGLRNISDIKEILGLLPIVKTACVLGDTPVAIAAACALKKKGIEVKLIARQPAADAVQQSLQSSGIELLMPYAISEILGNGDLKAIRLDSAKSKVIGCELLLVCVGYSPNTAIVKETEVKLNNDYIIVDGSLKTSVDNIYAAGDCIQNINPSWQEAIQQGALAARNILTISNFII